MTTYGQLRLTISQLMPGVTLELIDTFIQEIYTEILDIIPWKRQEAESVIQAPLSYAVGSVTVQQGSTTVTGAGTSWTSAMNGLMIRINTNPSGVNVTAGPPGSMATEYYQFQYVSATQGTLDRGYEQATSPILTTTPGNLGVNYNVGDIFNVVGGNGQAQGQVLQIGVGGSVAQYQLNNVGSGYSVGNGVATVTTGTGTGFTINITAITPATNLPYRIDQAIYLLPSNCRIVRQVRPLHAGWRGEPLEQITPAELNRIDPWRNTYGTPRFWSQTFDSFSNPPQMQLELYPVPNCPDSSGSIISWGVTYDFDAASIDPTQTSTGLLPWVRPSALISGVQMKLTQGKDAAAYQIHKSSFESLVKQMLMNNAYQRGAQTIRLAHELQRQTHPRYRRGPWHRGYTG